MKSCSAHKHTAFSFPGGRKGSNEFFDVAKRNGN